MKTVKKNILIINGSLGGAIGNTSVLIESAQKYLGQHEANIDILHLEENQNDLKNKLSWADGFIFTSGTYWDSWGSPMQRFLETCTQYEASDLFLYKPASVMITMHSVGGKGVLSRLQGVLNTMGLAIPPMSGLVYSLSSHLAFSLNKDQTPSDFSNDFWSLEDIEIVVHNLMTAVHHKHDFKCWPVDRKDPQRRWL
ncbi:MAG: NAD(P)H-dependent oxidoreductase [Bacteriovorax sp.]|nr:NAD(P)H-dependent oxidoreductase [Bacteriovorax sp.]